MITLRVIIDDVISPVPSALSRYAAGLTAGLIAEAPAGGEVEGIVAASTDEQYEQVLQTLPGLARLTKSPLARRELVSAWQHGFTRLPGMVHSVSLLAPLFSHDRINDPGQQTVVTLHDVHAWTHPDSMASRTVSWHKAMLKRAYRYADALVVPSHAVADQLGEIHDFSDRIRVISPAASAQLAVPADAGQRTQRLDLPTSYLVAVGGLEARRGLGTLLDALKRSTIDIPLVVITADEGTRQLVTSAATERSLAAGRVLPIGELSNDSYAAVLSGARALVVPSQSEGFSLPALEAFALGTPVIHSDAPALVELAADAGLEVASDDDYASAIADAIERVVGDDDLAERMSTAGRDRSRFFSWNSAAEKVWQLHADL